MLRIKPHHFLDILRDYEPGRAWSPHPYGHAVHTVAQSLVDNREQLLVLVLSVDDICRPCRNNVKGVCTDWTESPGHRIRKEEWNLRIDQRIFKFFGLEEGAVISALDLARLALRHLDRVHDIWCDNPKDQTQERLERLSRGLSAYLSGDRYEEEKK